MWFHELPIIKKSIHTFSAFVHSNSHLFNSQVLKRAKFHITSSLAISNVSRTSYRLKITYENFLCIPKECGQYSIQTILGFSKYPSYSFIRYADSKTLKPDTNWTNPVMTIHHEPRSEKPGSKTNRGSANLSETTQTTSWFEWASRTWIVS